MRKLGSVNGRQRGFSLAEILVVVAVVAVILLAVAPAFGDFARAWKVRSSADEILAKLRGVRQMAITMRQDLTVTFTPDPVNTYAYFHPIRKVTETIKLPARVVMQTNPTSAFAPVFRLNGSITNSSTPSTSAPTANFVEIRSVINSGRTDRYRFGFSAAGQVTYTVSR
jgi:prepilin-type N-terminal cleavage/methylation domain-containing protein